MHRTEINETRAWPVASYKIYRDVTLPLQCPWQVTTPFFPTHSATPPKTERQTVGHVIVTDCAKNSGNKAVFLTPPPFSQQWTRTKNNTPPTNTHHHPHTTHYSKGKWENEAAAVNCRACLHAREIY